MDSRARFFLRACVFCLLFKLFFSFSQIVQGGRRAAGSLPMAATDFSKSGVPGDDQEKTTSEGSEESQPAPSGSADVDLGENLDQTA